jgi:GTPase involved in cell partitioning and DNA repair
MNTDHTVHVHRLEGLIVVIDESKTDVEAAQSTRHAQGELTARGDELEDAGKLLKVAKELETNHMDSEADCVKEHVRDLVAKQLNEFDGFDR